MRVSKIFYWLLIGFVAGISLRSFTPISLQTMLIAVMIGIAFIAIGWLTRERFGGRRSNNTVVAGFGVLLIVLGIFWYNRKAQSEGPYVVQPYIGKEQMVFEGVVEDDPQPSARTRQLRVALDKPIQAHVVVFASKYPEYQYGDRIEITGKLVAPEKIEDFDYPGYLAVHDIYAIFYYPKIEHISSGQGNRILAKLFDIKHAFQKTITETFPEPQAAFLQGLLLGVKSGIPKEIINDFNTTGTTHIIALSGFNVTIIAATLAAFLRYLTVGARATLLMSSLSIAFFIIMTGAAASVVRAGIMAILLLVAKYEGKVYQARNAILLAGAGMLVLNPKLLRYDPGFQLSFLASLGLIYVTPRIIPYLRKIPEAFAFRENLATTLGAQLMVLPLLLCYFGTLSLISPLANLLILSTIPLAMGFGFLALLAALINSTVGVWVGSVAYALLTYELKVVELLADIPLASLSFGKVSWVVLVGMYMIIFRLLKKQKAP